MQYYRLKENGEILDCASFRYAGDCLETEEEIVRDFRGALRFIGDTQTESYLAEKKQFDEECAVQKIRGRRKKECFSVVNRGEIWYGTLTDEQKKELAAWYTAWLDAPATGVIPACPDWIA